MFSFIQKETEVKLNFFLLIVFFWYVKNIEWIIFFFFFFVGQDVLGEILRRWGEA